MDPELPTPRANPEQAPSVPQYERAYEMPPVTPERGIERSAEQYEQRAESSAQAAEQSAAPVLPTPVVPQPTSSTHDDNATTDNGVPLVANDDDLIEKEWVDKAKAIIASTKDDPYRREQEVSQLQIEYLRKRYGREIGEPN